ncbi:uncharacterized protein LOC143646853 isoform X3 [Tamandua tetradactyla]|uniref:uncharacterized protein LOC143646853 isoform X3 n=1 Tax=Tamandua tetradactyla TaxID=48850 RepID=UPI0040545B51
MPRGCLRDRPGSAEELWRAERPSGRCGPAGHRQHGLALEHPENLQKNWLWEFYQVILTFWTWCAVTGTLLLITDNIEYSCPATNECEITKCRQILPDLPLHEVFESGHAERRRQRIKDNQEGTVIAVLLFSSFLASKRDLKNLILGFITPFIPL